MHKNATKPSKPADWQPVVDGVKQPCWCGEEWHDDHEDGNHGPVAVVPR